MISPYFGRSSAARTASRLARQKRHVAPKIRLPVACAESSMEGSSSRASAFVIPPTSRAIASMAKPPRHLKAGRSITASSMVPEKLVTMVPWVPGPFQPLMDKLHPIMIAPRQPMAWLGVEALNTTTNFGGLCGHLSFGILTLAYIETDPLTLRYLVASGSTLNIMFNLFRVVGPPVWIPIKWNAGFLALNALMVILMLREIQEAEELKKDPEQARIYEEIFKPVQLSPLDFLRLMDVAERRVMLKGNDLTQEGRPHEEVFLIVEGTAEVRSEGVAVSHLKTGGFVGSMAFNRFMKTSSTPGAADDGGYDYHDGGMFRRAWDGFLHVVRKEGSVVGEVAKSVVGDKKQKRQDTSGLERSVNTVSATCDVVVYVWDQHTLREFIKRRPLIGASLQKAISMDLINKVNQSRDHKEHYRQLLSETLDGGRVTSTERRNLQRYREGHRISLLEHLELLRENNWTHKEFEAGFQEGVAPKDMSENFLKYEELLRQELSKGKLNAEAKSNLRKFRSQAGIDAQEHLIAVEKQGWTADEYEVGRGKDWMAGKYDFGGTADSDGPLDDLDYMEDFVEEASHAEKERYRLMLLAALGGGVVQPEDKEKLELYREMHAIPLEQHNSLLFEQGWKEEEFEAGFQKDIASSHFQQYTALVKQELDKGEVKPNAKSNLRNFRTSNGIDAQDHLLAVERQGWTADEFEAGTKSKLDGVSEDEFDLDAEDEFAARFDDLGKDEPADTAGGGVKDESDKPKPRS
ncbi:unnamed protein product [Pylaiella littoralis]